MKILDEIRGRLEAATPGPWWTPNHIHPAEVFSGTGLGDDVCVAEEMTKRDAEFIAHAREDVPKLLDALAAVESTAKYLDTLADGDKHYAKLFRDAVERGLGGAA
jgi:hypothetical protein